MLAWSGHIQTRPRVAPITAEPSRRLVHRRERGLRRAQSRNTAVGRSSGPKRDGGAARSGYAGLTPRTRLSATI
jgi:hypothetical protein